MNQKKKGRQRTTKRQLSFFRHVTENGWQRGIWTIERMTVLALVILVMLGGGAQKFLEIPRFKALVSGQNAEVFLVWPSYTVSIAGGCNCLPMWIWLPVASAQWRNANI